MPTRDGQQVAAIRAWCLYDWGNSAFACTVMAALFPPYFRELAVAAGVGSADATAYWGYTTALALAIVALIGPLLGAVADATGSRKRLLAATAFGGCAFTAAFVTIPAGGWRLAALLYMGANVGFAASIVFYEALLPHLARGRDLDTISSRGYAYGYLGGGLLLVLNMVWVTHPALFHLAGTGAAVKASFLSVAVWWAVFTVPLLRRVPEPHVGAGVRAFRLGTVWSDGWRRLRTTWRAVRSYRSLVQFLVAYWIYNDGIGTIIKMATAVGSEIGIGTSDLIMALVITQFVAWPSTLLLGRLARRLGARPVLLAGLGVYVLVCAFGFLMRTAWHFQVLAALVGVVQGGCQALSRSLFATMVPRHRSAEFFGFYSSSGKLAGIAGPLIFGLLSQTTGQGRAGILVLGVFFVVGGWLLARVDLAAGQARAWAEESLAAGRVSSDGAAGRS